jgi:Skp family chaperone for outer membrane proteins
MPRFAIRSAFALLAAALVVGAPAASFAQATLANVPVVVGVLDVQLIMRDSKAAKSVRSALDRQAAAYQAELAQQENALRNADQQLMQQRASLPADEFAKRSNELSQKADALRQTAEKRRQELQKMENGAMIQIDQSLLQAAAEIAKARGITLVLNKSAVLLNVQTYDITQDALKRLDAQLTSVKLPAPQ